MKKIALLLVVCFLTITQVSARGVAFTIDKTLWKKAQSIYLTALPKAEKKYGKESATYADLITNLAIVDVVLNDRKNAERLLNEASGIRTKLNGAESNELLSLEEMKADLFRESNRLDEAAKIYERCIEKVAIRKNIKPGDYDATIDDLLTNYVICDRSFSKQPKDGIWKFGKASISLPHRMSRCSLGGPWHTKMIQIKERGKLLGGETFTDHNGKVFQVDDSHSPKPWVPDERY